MTISDQSLASVELKLEVLNKKVDQMTILFDKLFLLLEKKKPKHQEETETKWSVTGYKDNFILISFSYNIEFKNYIKELGGMWMVSKKSWMFPKSNETNIIEQINEKFPTWKLI